MNFQDGADLRRRKKMLARLFREQENVGDPTMCHISASRAKTVPAKLTARLDRTKKVKEARDEAKKEVDAYRKEKDEEFKKFEAEHTSGNKKAEDDASKDAEFKIKEITSAGSKGQDKVVKDLLEAIWNPKPIVPERIEVPK
ncbi:H+-ATPase G subunit-domain-containing protein [Bisporella sp. PMI_857]|nr:H+-ATPase G subunit-domain-containing protein [Bisporella sp. PMI_857]